MRLTLTLPELIAGESLQQGTKDRISDISHLALRGDPVAINPIINHDQKVIAAVLLTPDVITNPGSREVTIKFRSIWCRTYTLCSVRKDDLLALLCEFEFGKYFINKDGAAKTDLTTTGPGCDPKVVQNAEIALGDMLAAPGATSDVLYQAMAFIKKSC